MRPGEFPGTVALDSIGEVYAFLGAGIITPDEAATSFPLQLSVEQTNDIVHMFLKKECVDAANKYRLASFKGGAKEGATFHEIAAGVGAVLVESSASIE